MSGQDYLFIYVCVIFYLLVFIYLFIFYSLFFIFYLFFLYKFFHKILSRFSSVTFPAAIGND